MPVRIARALTLWIIAILRMIAGWRPARRNGSGQVAADGSSFAIAAYACARRAEAAIEQVGGPIRTAPHIKSLIPQY